MLGTRWVAPGAGSTVREIYNALPASVFESSEFQGLRPFFHKRTSLELTGEKLQEYDVERAAVALARVRDEA